jgi:hypothetical protein
VKQFGDVSMTIISNQQVKPDKDERRILSKLSRASRQRIGRMKESGNFREQKWPQT